MYCHSIFTDTADVRFHRCVDLLDAHPLKHTDYFHNVYNIIDILCSNESFNTDLELYCSGRLGKHVFNASLYIENSLQYIIAAYISPSVYALVLVSNLILLAVLVVKIEKTPYFNLLACLVFVEIFIYAFQTFNLTTFLVKSNQDFCHKNSCLFVLVSIEMIPSLVHGISNYLILGIILHRYFVVTQPFGFKEKFDHKRNVILYCIGISCFSALSFISFITRIAGFPTAYLASKADHSQEIETLIVDHTVDRKSEFVSRVFLLHIIPVLMCTILEIKLYKTLAKRTTTRAVE